MELHMCAPTAAKIGTAGRSLRSHKEAAAMFRGRLRYARGKHRGCAGETPREGKGETMMIKNKLLVAAAVAALTAGSGLALAQGSADQKAPAQKAPAAEKSAPSGGMK